MNLKRQKICRQLDCVYIYSFTDRLYKIAVSVFNSEKM